MGLHVVEDRLDHPEQEPTPRRGGRRALKVLLVVLAVLLIAIGAIGLYLNAIRSSFNDNVSRDDLLPTYAEKPDDRPGMNFLLMGTDTRDPENDRGRSDALMLVHVPDDYEDVYIVSFPRDMWVEIPGRGEAKINAAYAFGGTPLTVQTMESLTGVPIDHVALVDFEGFKDMTTALGGVTVHNTIASGSHGHDFPQGEITIEGEEALIYVRERYNLPRGDLDRAERQRTVVQAILRKALSAQVVANPVKFTNFVEEFASYLTVDDQLTNQVIMDTATRMRVGTGDIHLMEAPISGFGTSTDGQSIDVVDEERLAELSEALQDDTMDEYYAKYGSAGYGN